MNDERADKLIDESGLGEGWLTGDGKVANESVTFEFPARTTLGTIVFDTRILSENKITAKDVRVEVSDVSATDGFQTILEATLKDNPDGNGARQGLDNQTFPVTKKVAGRFLRYTAINNFGSPKRIFTKEISGYGEQESLVMLENISGTYQSHGGAIIRLKQEGATIIGCNEQSGLIYEGAMNGRVFTYQAKTSQGKPEGFGFFSFAPDGQKAKTSSYPYGKDAFAFSSTAEKKSDQIGNCKNLLDLDSGKDAVKDSLEKNLAESGRTTLYGINFDFNSDIIRSESKPTLDKVIAISKEKPDWKFSVEGHTDNIGGEAFNQTLSERRASAVKKYLTDAGIAPDKLQAVGKGASQPIAPNDSEIGRAQNRRVELVKQ